MPDRVSRASGEREPHTLEADLVAPQRRYRLPEKLLGVLAASIDARDVDFFEFDGNAVGLEDDPHRLGDFGADAITWARHVSRAIRNIIVGRGPGRTGNKCNSVFPAEFGWLGQIGLHSGHRWAQKSAGGPRIAHRAENCILRAAKAPLSHGCDGAPNPRRKGCKGRISH
jgi:hypothetical protein